MTFCVGKARTLSWIQPKRMRRMTTELYRLHLMIRSGFGPCRTVRPCRNFMDGSMIDWLTDYRLTGPSSCV